MKRSFYVPIEDTVSGAVEVIDHTHGEIHEGSSFSLLVRKTGSSPASASIMFRTPASGRMHSVFRISCNVAAEFIVYESGSLSASGTLLTTIRNRDRNSAVAATLQARSTATISNGVVLVGEMLGAAGVGTTKGAGTGGNREEFILKASTVYTLKVIFGAASGVAYMGADWYEKT